jgi:NAD(P)-dependent dehydrogenase (short-subunit alcohol dehydrogenase family)
MEPALSEKVALVTCAARGIGKAIALKLAREGAAVHGRIAKSHMGAYGASKGFTRQLAPHGIAVNAVACGAIRTEINLPLYQSKDPADLAAQAALRKRIPMTTVGEPEDIAGAVAFLASPIAARYIAGAVLSIDGGYAADGTVR